MHALRKRAKEAINQAKRLGAEKARLEQRNQRLTARNEQLNEKKRELEADVAEQKALQLRALMAANTKLQASKNNGQRDRRKHDEIRRALEGGEALLLEELDNEEHERTQGSAVGSRSLWQRVFTGCSKLTRWVDRAEANMGKDTIRFVEARYGGGISVYFVFLQWVWMVNCVTLALVAMVLLLLALDGLRQPHGLQLLPAWPVGSGQVPRLLLFSSFSSKLRVPVVLIACLVPSYLVLSASRKVNAESGRQKALQIFAEQDKFSFSLLAFSGWDFNLHDAASAEDAKLQARRPPRRPPRPSLNLRVPWCLPERVSGLKSTHVGGANLGGANLGRAQCVRRAF